MAFRRDPFEHSSARRSAAVVVAHPDDETLWSGGTILDHPNWGWFIVSLCRKSDPDRSARFRKALAALGAAGELADLDDGPDQTPLDPGLVASTCIDLLGPASFDLVLTHGPQGEYTRHRRHEEVSRAVAGLWLTNRLQTGGLLMFAFEDGDRACCPRPRADAHFCRRLETPIWERKRSIITGVYGFAADSWEARTTPRREAFWSFDSKEALSRWLTARGIKHEDSRYL